MTMRLAFAIGSLMLLSGSVSAAEPTTPLQMLAEG